MKEIHVNFLDRLMDSYTHAANMLLLIVSCFQENKNSNTLNNSDTARMVLKKCELLLKSHHEVELDVSIMLKSLSQHKQHAQVEGKELKKIVSEMQNMASLAKLTVQDNPTSGFPLISLIAMVNPGAAIIFLKLVESDTIKELDEVSKQLENMDFELSIMQRNLVIATTKNSAVEIELNNIIYLYRLIINSLLFTNNTGAIEIQTEQIAKTIGHVFQSYCRLAARFKRLRSEVPLYIFFNNTH